jgi:hypothetical protein
MFHSTHKVNPPSILPRLIFESAGGGIVSRHVEGILRYRITPVSTYYESKYSGGEMKLTVNVFILTLMFVNGLVYYFGNGDITNFISAWGCALYLALKGNQA